MALRTLSLCAGIGGIDLALERIGAARTVCYVEREAYAAAVLAARMEEGALAAAPIWSDLATFDGRAWRGAVDLVTAGYPCQPFSLAGSRSGTDDERHLWPHVYRVLQECGAPLLFCENVRGHLSLGFADVLADLAAIGFDVEWGCVSACALGAPHTRSRLFFLAHSRRFRANGQQHGWVCRPSGEGEADAGRARGDVGWPAEPPAVGVPDGVPYWLDRLRALGNAVVPACAALAWRELTARIQ